MGTSVEFTLSCSATLRKQHLIQKNETLTRIAKKYGTTIKELIEANKSNKNALPNPKNPNLIIAGKKLTIPGGTECKPAVNVKEYHWPGIFFTVDPVKLMSELSEK